MRGRQIEGERERKTQRDEEEVDNKEKKQLTSTPRDEPNDIRYLYTSLFFRLYEASVFKSVIL